MGTGPRRTLWRSRSVVCEWCWRGDPSLRTGKLWWGALQIREEASPSSGKSRVT